MSLSASSGGPTLGGMRVAVRRLEVAWPVLLTALVLGTMVTARLAGAHWNPSVFIQFGRPESRYIHPPAGAPIQPTVGYDGQLYWLQATSPLLRSAAVRHELARGWPAYHLQRPGYPMAAWLLAGGHRSLLPWSLLLVNVISVLGLTLAFALYARRRGWNPAWALAVGLAPGMLVPTLGDLSDVMATACLLGGLMCWERGRAWAAALLVAIAALTREPMILATVAFAADLLIRGWRRRHTPRELTAVLRRGWPAVLVPLLAFVGWRVYVSAVDVGAVHGGVQGAISTGSGSGLWPPYANVLHAADSALHGGSGARAGWILAYLALTVVAMLWGGALLVRNRSAAVLLGPLLSIVLGFVFLSDQWALTRYTAPVFLALLLAGLEHRSRVALFICGASAAMTLLLPML